MNYLSKITSLATVCVLVFCLQPARGQSDIDNNRMQRDINIMENILEEMFKTSWEARGNTVRVGSVAFGRNNDIRGTYLPDYGVIFNIPGGPPAFVIETDSDDEGFAYNFQYGDSDGEKVDEESITSRIVEFLRDYSSTIGQLSNSDRVMVIYSSNVPDREFTIFRSDDSNVKRQKIPSISVVAKKSDLQAYRSGDLSDEQFRNRLDISTAEANERAQKDLKVMAGIFESAFEDSDSESFRIAGSVDYLKLDNFGALFSFDARYAQRSEWSFSKLQRSLESIGKDLENARDELEEEIRVSIDIKDSVRAKNRKEIQEKRSQHQENVRKGYDTFVNDLKEYLVDYGRTLSSIKSNQYILVSVSLPNRYDKIPERLDLQIRKSQLDAMDTGKMSRSQVMNQIKVQEY